MSDYYYQIFAFNLRKEILPIDELRIDALRKEAAQAEKDGLHDRVAALEREIATIRRVGLIDILPLFPVQLAIWRAWLPIVFDDSGNNARRQLSDFDCSDLPLQLMREWEASKKTGAFEHFEIWTSDKQRGSVLIGVNGDVRHLLAQWVKKEHYLSYGDIKRELVRLWHANAEIGNEPWEERRERMNLVDTASLAARCVLGVALIGAIWLQPISYPYPLLAVGAACIFSALTFWWVLRWKTQKLCSQSPLMQAIARSNAGELR